MLSPPISTSNTPDQPKEEKERIVAEVRIPDGGLRAWSVVLGGFLNFITAFGIMNSFGVFQSHYAIAVLDKEAVSTVAWIGSVQLFLMFVGGLFVGPAFDRWGARRIMVPGAIICVMSHICTSFASKYYQILLSQGFLFGIRNAMLYYPTAGAITEWFNKRRALALGLAISGSSIGGIFWPLLITRLLIKVGFSWTHRIIAFSSLPVLAIACFLVKERKGAVGHDIHGHRLRSPPRFFKEIFQRQFLALCASLFFIFMGMLVPFNYIGLYADAVGLLEHMGSRLLAICYAGSVVGRILNGWFADRLGRFNVLIAISLATGVLILCWTRMTTLAGQVIFSLFYGFFSGGLVPLGSACVAQTTTDIGHLGLRIGVMMALCSPGTLTGNPIAGVLLAKLSKWEAVHVFAGSTVLLGTILLL